MTPKGVNVSWQMENSESDDSDECGDKMDVHSGKLDAINKLLILEGHKPLTMKFISTRYREAQSDFFGKRGISWHISVCLRKTDKRLEAQTFIHILESGLQDSETVVLIMEHVLRSLKLQHPEITSAYFRQDNAGCYHSSCTIFSARVLSSSSKIQVKQIDFSDPQGGKGAS